MSALSEGGILGLSTVSIALDFSLHSSWMAWPLSPNVTGNHSVSTCEPPNASTGANASWTSIREKNWPALLILIIISLTIGGNILVILAVSLEKKLQNATNYFLMSLAVADMLVGILVMPVSLITILYNYAWPLPKQLCPIWISLDVLFSTASIMHLCAISLDRYVAIRNPIQHSRFNSRTKAVMKIAAVWTISMGISLPIPVISLQDDSRVFVNGSCVLNDENFVLVGSFVAFFIPLMIMVFTYCLTIQVLQKQATLFLYGEPPKQRRNSMNCLKTDNVENLSMLQNQEAAAASHLNSPINKEAVLFRKGTMQSINNERRASKVLGIVFFLFLVMWCPFFITNIMSVLCKDACDQALLRELLDVFVWVGYICSGVNPLVYTLFNKTYRRAFSNYIRCHYKSSRKASQPHHLCPNVSTAFYGKDLNLNSCHDGHEPNSIELNETEDALEIHVGTPENTSAV